jgi:carboxypeptidase Q
MRPFLAGSALALVLAATGAAGAPAPSYSPVDPQMLNRIADAGFNHGQIVQTIEYLSDQIGGRMTNSPAMRKAEAWTQAKYGEWGLQNVHKEGFEFGRGWWIESSHVRMTSPRPIELRAIPLAWSPATNGPVSGPVIVAPIRTEADFARWRGKLKGRIVLTSAPTAPRDDTSPPFSRLTDADLLRLDAYQEPSYDPEAMARRRAQAGFAMKLDSFLASEGALARATMSRSEGRIVHGEGSGFRAGQTPQVPAVELGAEDYRRLARLAKVGEVTVEVDNKVHYDDSDSKAYNIIADIPGADARASYVMAGAHLDSWVAGDGAADNGAGAAVVMEAARILASLHVRPKRAIRFALWAGEEEGLLGSFAYVDQHLARRPANEATARFGPYSSGDFYPIAPLPGFAEMNGYFNIDNGSGKVRGIYTEGNFAVAPIFREWLAPFASLGASTVVARPTGSTDHVFMVRLGLPAFQFIQDPLDYESRVHHSDLDTFDHLRTDDMRQAAVVLAAMLLDAANSDAPLPRNVMPTAPEGTDPFRAEDPAQPGRR